MKTSSRDDAGALWENYGLAEGLPESSFQVIHRDNYLDLVTAPPPAAAS